MPIKPLSYIDKHGYRYSPEVQAKIDAVICAKAIELSQNYQPNPEPMQSIGYEVKPVSEEKKPELRRLEAEDVPDEVKQGFAQGGYVGEQKPLMVRDPEPEPLIAGKFAPRFDIKNFSGTIREIMTFLINTKGIVNTKVHFDEAQEEVVKLRNRLQDAYNSEMKKRLPYVGRLGKKPFFVPDMSLEIWMYGAAAYDLITEQGRRLQDVLNMPWSDITEKAKEQGELFKKKAEQEGDAAYMIKKKSREKE